MYIPQGKILKKYYYTGGNEFTIPSGIKYTGYYHKDVYGNSWTGKTHDNTSVILKSILPTTYLDNNSDYNGNTLKYNNINKSANILGTNAKPIQVSNFSVNRTEYEVGFKTRYFIKYNASTRLKFDELSSSTYKDLQLDNSQYHTVMYTLVSLMWRVRGPLEDQYKDNILIKPGVYSSNKRSVDEAEKTCPGIRLYLTDLTEGAIIEP